MLSEWIQLNLFCLNDKNRPISKRCTSDWFKKTGNEAILKLIVTKTNFLPEDSSIIQRCWHIVNNIYYIPICDNPDCEKYKQFYTFKIGYRNNCSVKCAQRNPTTKEKIKHTNKIKYGKFYVQTDEFKLKSKKTILNKYGVDNISKLNSIKKTRSIKMSTQEYQNKLHNGVLLKYGVDNVAKIDSIKNKRTLNKRMNHFKNYFLPYLAYNKLSFISPVELYLKNGVDKSVQYEFKCNICNMHFHDHCYSHLPRCKNCFPLYISKAQSEIYQYLINELKIENVILNDKTLLGGSEIDIYLPDYKLAIEYDGLYWHSELNGKDKNYHLNKTTQCNKLGIQLIHIFEDEWLYKKEIVKSILRSKLHKTSVIYARKCDVRFIKTNLLKPFLNENHLQGYVNSKYNIGLFHDNILVSVMTFGKNRFSNKFDLEMLRFATKLNLTIVGGASKMLAFFKKNVSFINIISFADKRWSNGNLYESLGFKKLSSSLPGYGYFNLKNSYRIQNRLKFQKWKLNKILHKFDANLTEWQNMQLNGYDRIWDCGNLKYIFSME